MITSYTSGLPQPSLMDQRAATELSTYCLAKRWYALFTVPQNEKTAVKHLNLRAIESLLPTYESIHIWKNRQRVRLQLPLFPSYLFVRIDKSERGGVLACPGILRIVGNGREPLAVPDHVIDFLRSDLCVNKIEPYNDLIIGQKVRIRRGAMEGVEGVLVRKNNSLRFVLTVYLINQYAAVEIDPRNLEPAAN